MSFYPSRPQIRDNPTSFQNSRTATLAYSTVPSHSAPNHQTFPNTALVQYNTVLAPSNQHESCSHEFSPPQEQKTKGPLSKNTGYGIYLLTEIDPVCSRFCKLHTPIGPCSSVTLVLQKPKSKFPSALQVYSILGN
jgi:hypothetical protein